MRHLRRRRDDSCGLYGDTLCVLAGHRILGSIALTPYDGTCTTPIPQWLCDWVAGQWLSLVLEVPRLWCREYEADDCEAFEEGSS